MKFAITQSLFKGMLLVLMVSAMAACSSKKSDKSVISPDTKQVPKNVNSDGTESIEPVVVINPDGTATTKGTDQNQDKNKQNQNQNQDQQNQQPNDELTSRKALANRYSGSADDALRGFLEYKLDSVTERSLQLRNIRSAQAIKSASLKMDLSSAAKKVEMRLLVDAGSQKDKEVLFKGQLSGDRTASLTTSYGGNMAMATAKCMDKVISSRVSTCETVHVRIELGAKGNRSFVHIIFRRTNVDLAANFPVSQCKTQDCEDLYTVFAVSQLNNRDVYNVEKDPTRLKRAKLDSFEIINGRSGAKLTMITRANELMNFSSELINPKVISQANLQASTEVNFFDQDDQMARETYKTRLNDKMKDVRVVANNGKGQITAIITTRDDRRNVSDSFELVATRLSKDIESVVEVVKP